MTTDLEKIARQEAVDSEPPYEFERSTATLAMFAPHGQGEFRWCDITARAERSVLQDV